MYNGRIFDSVDGDLENSKIPSSSELKNKPDGWETTSKAPDGNVWEMSQREEDILLQEFDRRISYCKFQVCIFVNNALVFFNSKILVGNAIIAFGFPTLIQIASFIKTHIFSRRRPIDGWKYMIEEIGPNARKGKGKGSVSRLPTLSDASTQPFREEKLQIESNLPRMKGR